MKRIWIFPALLATLVACGDQFDTSPGGVDQSVITIDGGDPNANGVLDGLVYGAEYGANWDTVTSPLGGVTVEVYQRVAVAGSWPGLLLDSIPWDSLPPDSTPGDTIVVDSIPGDTLPNDTLPSDTVVVDTLPNDSLPTLLLRGTAVTDANGHFAVTGIPAGEYVIFIKPEESAPWSPTTGWTYVSDGTGTHTQTFHVWRKLTLAPRR
jgi:hypothetical protein